MNAGSLPDGKDTVLHKSETMAIRVPAGRQWTELLAEEARWRTKLREQDE